MTFVIVSVYLFFFFKQKTVYELRISDWSSDVCSSDLSCRTVVNAAGLFAPDVARNLQRFPRDKVPPRYFAKGNYFMLSGRSPFSRLVYPVPREGGLGLHITVDLAEIGRAHV